MLAPNAERGQCERRAALLEVDEMGGHELDQRPALDVVLGEAGEIEHRCYCRFRRQVAAEKRRQRGIQRIGEMALRQGLAARRAGGDPGGDHQSQMLRQGAGFKPCDGGGDNALRQFLATVIGDLRRTVGERGVGETLCKFCRVG